jgi:Mn-dependent DtxR family transcriptional regulator
VESALLVTNTDDELDVIAAVRWFQGTWSAANADRIAKKLEMARAELWAIARRLTDEGYLEWTAPGWKLTVKGAIAYDRGSRRWKIARPEH